MHVGAHFGISGSSPLAPIPLVPTGTGVDWDPWQDAIAVWVGATCGLPVGHWYWADQDGVRNVPAPYVVMRVLNDSGRTGQDQRRHEVDPGDDAITAIVEGPRIIRISLTCFSEEVLGNTQPMAILNRIMQGARLPSVFELLRAANIAIGPALSVVNLPDAEAFQARATCQLDVTVMSTISEPGHVIRTVQFQAADHDLEITVDSST